MRMALRKAFLTLVLSVDAACLDLRRAMPTRYRSDVPDLDAASLNHVPLWRATRHRANCLVKRVTQRERTPMRTAQYVAHAFECGKHNRLVALDQATTRRFMIEEH